MKTQKKPSPPIKPTAPGDLVESPNPASLDRDRRPLDSTSLDSKFSGQALTPLQALIADEVADMLIHGGHEDDINDLLWAVSAHQTRKRSSGIEDDPAKIDESVNKYTRNAVESRKADLAVEWRRNCRAAPEDKKEPVTATARIRAVVINTLRNQLDWFLLDGTPEEHYLMAEIMTGHLSYNRGRSNLDELPLAQAITEVTEGTLLEFVRVPVALRKQVDQYLDHLKAVAEGMC